MLLSNHHELQYPRVHQTHSFNYRAPSSLSAPSTVGLTNAAMPQRPRPATSSQNQDDDGQVAQALEVARDSPDGCQDPKLDNILETAMAQTWAKIQAQPDAYVMSRDEFAVFNFFQHRFVGNKLAISARKRYWDNTIAVQ